MPLGQSKWAPSDAYPKESTLSTPKPTTSNKPASPPRPAPKPNENDRPSRGLVGRSKWTGPQAFPVQEDDVAKLPRVGSGRPNTPAHESAPKSNHGNKNASTLKHNEGRNKKHNDAINNNDHTVARNNSHENNNRHAVPKNNNQAGGLLVAMNKLSVHEPTTCGQVYCLPPFDGLCKEEYYDLLMSIAGKTTTETEWKALVENTVDARPPRTWGARS